MVSVEDGNAPSVVAADGMLMIEAKPEGLPGPEETTVPLWCRGGGPQGIFAARPELLVPFAGAWAA